MFISKIKQLIEEAKLFAQENSVEHNKFDEFRYYKVLVKLNGETYPIYLNVGRAKNNTGYHIYDITKKIRGTAKQNALERVNDDLRSEISPPTDRIPQPNENVNPDIRYSKETLSPEEAEEINKRNSQLYESLRDKDVSYDETKGALGENEERFKYSRISNAKTYNKAKAYVDRTGIKEAEGRLTEKALNGKLWNANEMAQAEYIFTQLQKQGKTQEAVNFAVTFAGQATKAGQAVQAMAILNRLTPEGKLLYITRMSERATQDNIENKKWGSKKRAQFESELEEAKKKDAREKKNADELEDLYRKQSKENGELADLFTLSSEDFEGELKKRKEQIEKLNSEKKDTAKNKIYGLDMFDKNVLF